MAAEERASIFRVGKTHDSAREVIARWLRPEAPSDVQAYADLLLSALQSAGYAVVPVEPSHEIRLAVARSIGGSIDETSHMVRADLAYRAMLLAAEEKNDARK